jgi:hypothetical protein
MEEHSSADALSAECDAPAADVVLEEEEEEEEASSPSEATSLADVICVAEEEGVVLGSVGRPVCSSSAQ